MRGNVLIVGAGVLDVLVCPVKEDVFRKGSVPVETIRVSAGGDGLNEATVLARLKGKEKGQEGVRLLTLLGEDEAGEMLWGHCEREGICMELSVRDRDVCTGVNVVMVEENGERSFFTNPSSSLRKLSIEHMPQSFPRDVGILCFASIFVSPLFGGREMAELFRRAKEQGILVCADMTKCKNQETTEDIKEALSYLDYLFANQEEANMVTGKESMEEMAEVLYSCGVKNVIIKCGGKGCYVKNASLKRSFPAAEGVRCVDTTGAGDSFAGGFLYALAEGKTFTECVRYGNACGSLAVETVGACTGIINKEQAEKRMECLRD